MTRPSETTTRHRVRRPHGGLGERVRTLRVNAGLTQTALAGDRFSKEYVSQIERGKTRPTQETIEWLAQRLGVDPGFLASGVSADERGRIETALARAEALTENHEYDEALEEFRQRSAALCSASRHPSSRSGRSPASPGRSCELGEVKPAIDLLQRARVADRGRRCSRTSTAPTFCSDSAPAATRSRASRRRSASSTRRWTLAERSELPCDRLRADILDSARPLLPTAAGLRGSSRGPRARARALGRLGRPPLVARCVLPGLAHRRAPGPVGPRAEVRRAGEGAVRGNRRPRDRRPSDEQPRRDSTSSSASPRRRSSS